MNLMRLGVLCVCALFGPLLSDLTDLARAATLEDAGGGALTAPVVQGNYFYIGTGTTLAVWDMTDPLHPALAGRTRSAPAPGPIRALTKVGGYLYAGWNSSSGIGGLIVYSLADPAHPAVAATIDRYVDADYRDPHGLAVSGHYVLVGDNANGLVVLDATDPLQPSFVTQDFNVTAFDSMTLSGSQLFAYGNSFIGTVIGAYDVSDPAAPVYESQLGLSLDDGVFRALLTDGYAIGIGTSFVVYDLADPMDIKSIASVPMDPATNAVRAGNTVYVFGATGIQVWDFSTPASPALVRTVDVGDAVFNTDQTASTPFGPMVLTHTDRAFLIGTADPQNPTLAASLTIPFGVGAYSAGFDAGHVYFAEDSYGLAAADRATNAPIGRLDVALDPIPAARAFEDVSVVGGRA
ncbi:MAG TPA: hypothetical protein VF132_07600, partial [Rudaea sp.]